MSTSEKRRPLNIDLNGYGTVSSTELYTLDEAADIQRMVVEIFNKVGYSYEQSTATPGAIEVVVDEGR